MRRTLIVHISHFEGNCFLSILVTCAHSPTLPSSCKLFGILQYDKYRLRICTTFIKITPCLVGLILRNYKINIKVVRDVSPSNYHQSSPV